jgi:1,2-diacylglycerol-3-alpha-glucose alpha-1,2-galactosyltransferase
MPEVKFVWAGGRPFGGLTEGIGRINDRLSNAGNNFINAGNVELEHMAYIYASADLMIFPSYQENCPLAPVEAAACGMPVIYRDIEEYKSLYENPYLKASGKEEFIRLVKRMIHDKEFYNEGLEISGQLLKQFDKNIIREKLIGVYHSLLDDWQASSLELSMSEKDLMFETTI